VSLRVGLLCHDSVGGSARVAVNLSLALAERGHDVHLFARSTPLELRDGCGPALHTLSRRRAAGRSAARLDTAWPAADVEALVALVVEVARDEELDLLHFHYAAPFAEVAERARRRLRPRAPAVVGTLHGTDVSGFDIQADTRRRLAGVLACANVLTTVSSSHAELAVQTFGLAEPPDVIPNFIDARRFQPRAGAGGPPRRPRIVHVSNFRPVKQPLIVASVFGAVRRSADAELWLVGDGEGMPGLRGALERDGLADATRCFGLRLDLDRILPEADLLLVTSRTESFCLAALEAAACGVPAVAPRVGGLPDTVVDGETGILFEGGDDRGAADALLRLLDDGSLRRRLAAAAVAHAGRLSHDAVVPRYERLYRDVLDLARLPLPTAAQG
jgi:N-acetyl-alpha-D-glucosaminyl L-malate synthase BshA